MITRDKGTGKDCNVIRWETGRDTTSECRPKVKMFVYPTVSMSVPFYCSCTYVMVCFEQKTLTGLTGYTVPTE